MGNALVAKPTHASVDYSVLSSGRHLMASFGTLHVRTPAEVLQPSQDSSIAQRVRNMKGAKQCFGSWNVCSMLATYVIDGLEVTEDL